MISPDITRIWPSTASILKGLSNPYKPRQSFATSSVRLQDQNKSVPPTFVSNSSTPTWRVRSWDLNPSRMRFLKCEVFSFNTCTSTWDSCRIAIWDQLITLAIFGPASHKHTKDWFEKLPSEFEPFQPSNWLIERSFNASAFWVLKYFSGITLHPEVKVS